MVTTIDFSDWPLRSASMLSFLKNNEAPHLKEAYNILAEWIDPKESMLFYTSGSTGAPKPIEIPKRYVLASIQKTAEAFHLKAGMKFFNPLPPSFVAGKMMWLRALELKAMLYVSKPATAPELPEEEIDFAAFTPHQLIQLFEKNDQRIKGMKQILLGGMGLFPYLRKNIAERKLNVRIGYGMTETVSHIALYTITEKDEPPLYEALPGVTFSVDTEQKLIIQVAYFDHLKLMTNDIVECVSETQIRYIGRADRVVNSGGRKVQPERLEEKLNEVLHVPFYLCGKFDEVLGERLILMIEAEENSQDHLLREVLNHWDAKDQPKEIHYKKAFLRTTSGKIIKKYYE